MKIKGNLEFEVEFSATELCEIAGTITPEESKDLREKLMTDPEFKAKIIGSSVETMFTGFSKFTENFMKAASIQQK